MQTIEQTKQFQAAPDAVFDCLDDLGVSGMHMTQSSMPLMGGKMHLEFLSEHRTGPHTRYRWTGKVLWMPLDFTVEVTQWIRGQEKIWQTTGPAQLILYSWFQMALRLVPAGRGCVARLSIRYKKPRGLVNQLLCFLVGRWYGRWCLSNMLNDAEKRLTRVRMPKPESYL